MKGLIQLLLFAGIAAVIVFAIVKSSKPPTAEEINQKAKQAEMETQKKQNEEIETNKFGAYLTSQEFIKNQLKAPSTAKFAKTTDSSVIMSYSETSKEYTTVLWVDAQNSFGAMIRTHFKVVLKMSDDKKQWLLVSLNKLE